MKTILLTIPIGMSVRNILRTNIYRVLRENCKVIILSPQFASKDFRDEFMHPNTTFANLPPQNGWRALLLNKYRYLQYVRFWRRYRVETIEKYMRRLKSHSPLGYFFWMTAAFTWDHFASRIGLDKITRWVVFYHPYYENLSHKFNIDLVFTATTDVEQDMVVLHQAKKQGIPVVTMAHSWDGLPSRGFLSAQPDKLIVWNKIMQEQGFHLHGIPDHDVFIAGIPQYDEYLYNTRILLREEYCTVKGIPRTAKIITYTCGASHVFPDEPEFIQSLIDHIHHGVFGVSVLILRLHPTENRERYRQLYGNVPDVVIDEPDPSFAATYVTGKISRDGNEQFVNLIYHSDVVLNLASTTTIDAAIFDRPVVNIAYNIHLPCDAWNSAANWYKSTHYKHVVASVGVRVAYDTEELVKYITMYFEDPTIDQEGRKRIVKEQCYKFDGKAGERIAQFMLNMLDEMDSKSV